MKKLCMYNFNRKFYQNNAKFDNSNLNSKEKISVMFPGQVKIKI